MMILLSVRYYGPFCITILRSGTTDPVIECRSRCDILSLDSIFDSQFNSSLQQPKIRPAPDMLARQHKSDHARMQNKPEKLDPPWSRSQ